MKEKIVIAGGTGALGTCLINQYYGSETEVVILSRTKKATDKNIRYRQWDAQFLGSWTDELEGSKAVINLVGKSVNCRYTEANKKEIIASRVNSTLAIGKAIRASVNPPEVWINAGSAAIFGNSGDILKKEGDSLGSGFSPGVCKQWEQAFNRIQTPLTRKVVLRIGMVLQQGKGVLKPFVNLAKFGLGGKIGSGSQYITWIHEQDFIQLIEWVIKNDEISGVLHASSPRPVTNSEFMRSIRQANKVPFGLPSPPLLTKIGATLIGTEAELVLSGRRVVSNILEEKRFSFRYPEIQNALNQLIQL